MSCGRAQPHRTSCKGGHRAPRRTSRCSRNCSAPCGTTKACISRARAVLLGSQAQHSASAIQPSQPDQQEESDFGSRSSESLDISFIRQRSFGSAPEGAWSSPVPSPLGSCKAASIGRSASVEMAGDRSETTQSQAGSRQSASPRPSSNGTRPQQGTQKMAPRQDLPPVSSRYSRTTSAELPAVHVMDLPPTPAQGAQAPSAAVFPSKPHPGSNGGSSNAAVVDRSAAVAPPAPSNGLPPAQEVYSPHRAVTSKPQASEPQPVQPQKGPTPDSNGVEPAAGVSKRAPQQSSLTAPAANGDVLANGGRPGHTAQVAPAAAPYDRSALQVNSCPFGHGTVDARPFPGECTAAAGFQ